jgi:hypothetical protein
MAEKDGWSGIERGEDRCGACGRDLGAGDACWSALYAEGDSFRRRDYCAACFGALPERPASFWKRAPRRGAGKRDETAARAARRRDLDALLDLFERLAEPEPVPAGGPGAPRSDGDGDAHRAKLRYLLALALVRKRRLELVELAREGGADCLIVRASGDAELVTIQAPKLSEDDLARLSRELEAEVGLS